MRGNRRCRILRKRSGVIGKEAGIHLSAANYGHLAAQFHEMTEGLQLGGAELTAIIEEILDELVV